MPPALGKRSLNHWTTKEVPTLLTIDATQTSQIPAHMIIRILCGKLTERTAQNSAWLRMQQASLVSAVKNPPTVQEMQEMQVRPLSGEDPLKWGMETQSSILAWRIPEEPGGLQATQSQRAGTWVSDWAPTHTHTMCLGLHYLLYIYLSISICISSFNHCNSTIQISFSLF